METTSPGELVKVASGGPELDGIVFDTPSRAKVVVAVVEPGRGSPPPARGGAGGSGAAPGRGRPGHSRGAMHPTRCTWRTRRYRPR